MLFIGRQYLIPGQLLMRRDIAALFGGNTRSFLPQTGGDVVAGCFVPAMNPRLPSEVLVGGGPMSVLGAKRLLAKRDPIPIFIKRATARWEYVGEFKAAHYTTDKREVSRRIYEIMPRIYETYRKSYGDIRGILFLEEA